MINYSRTLVNQHYLDVKKRKNKPKYQYSKDRFAIIERITGLITSPVQLIKINIHATKHVTVNQQLRAYLMPGVLFIRHNDRPRCRSPPLQSEFFDQKKFRLEFLIMFDFPYVLRAEPKKKPTRYFVSFIDGQNKKQELEVEEDIYSAMNEYKKIARNIYRSNERNQDFLDISDENFNDQIVLPMKSAEEIVLDKLTYETVEQEINNLPKVQRRRFILYHKYGYTYQEIADIEGCIFQAIAKSIKLAEEKIKKVF